ncbi:MAG TPA: ATP-binding protein [Candidatus Polarisedimenticolaceae bacterium]
MSRRRTLRARLAWWFAGALLVLYGAAATMGWLYAFSTARQFATLTLKTEAEELARFVAESGRLDAPELGKLEELPVPMWLRVLRDGVVIAATPGIPPVPPFTAREAAGRVIVVEFNRGGPYLLVRHAVTDPGGPLAVEAIGSLAPLRARELALAAGLALAGLVVIPLAAVGGRALAGRALGPLDDLVDDIRALDPARLDARLRAPRGTVEEVAVLASAFNDQLARLEAVLESMRRFTGDASHEIRNPLSVLRAGIEVALRRERDPEEYRRLLRENLQEIVRLHAVVEGLLALAREVPGRPYPVARLPVDLSALVESAVGGFEVVASERGVTFDLESEPEVIVSGDANLLRLVVFNLVDNALKHGPAGEPVSIRVAREGSVARVVIADRGPGVPAEDRGRLFERFYRAAESGGAGTGGLGLSVVRWVTELHGGEVRLLDEGGGCAFEVTLPA